MNQSGQLNYRHLIVVIGILAAVVIAAGVVIGWMYQAQSAAAESTSQATNSAFQPIDVSQDGEPHIVTEEELRAFGTKNGPLYWSGPRDDVDYELTYTTDGSVYVRYLPVGTTPGIDDSKFLTVANYVVENGYEELAARGGTEGYSSATTQNGAVILNSASDDRRAYFAFPDVPHQVEVFDPEPGAALELVSDGSIVLLQDDAE